MERRRILLVDDDPEVRAVVASMLQQRGHEVLEAGNGEVALVIISQDPRPIDLLLTDVQMPKMGGLRLAEQARGIRPHLPVLYMSGWAGADSDDARLQVRDSLLAKPFTPEELEARIRTVL